LVDLLDAVQELEESKRQREWAFGERDKIVSERDNVRVLCDQLRHERDGAVSDLFSALRDSDDIRRQKNDAIRELKEFRYLVIFCVCSGICYRLVMYVECYLFFFLFINY